MHRIAALLLLTLLPVLGQISRPPEEDKNHSRRRIEWQFQQRAQPQGYLPADLRLRALRDMEAARRKMPRLAGAAAAAAQWTPVGPFSLTTPYWLSPISGRVNAIVTDPRNANILYVGASEGGVWKSTDGGQSFIALTDSQPSLSIGSIALDPSNPNIVYVGTGSEIYGAGILKSTDAGANWTSYPGPFVGPFGSDDFFGGGTRILSLAVSPTNPQVVLAAVWRWPLNQGGIFRSSDGGATWTQVLSGPGRDVAFRSKDGTGMLATLASHYASPAAGLYQSPDAGLTWTPLLANGPTQLPRGLSITDYRLANSANFPATLYVAAQINSVTPTEVYKSNDGGTTWARTAAPPAPCCITMAVDPVDANLVIGGGIGLDSIFLSSDAGSSWQSISGITQRGYANAAHADVRAIYFTPDGSTLYNGNDGGIYRMGDPNGVPASWTSLNASLAITEFYPSIAIHPTNPGMMLGGTQDNGTLNLSDTHAWSQSACGDAGWSAIDSFSPNIMYTTCQNIDVERSTASGAVGSWVKMVRGINASDPVSFIAPMVIDASSPQTLYFGTYRVYQTNNSAASWTAISPDLTRGGGTLSAIAIAPADSNIVYAASTDSNVWVSNNARSSTPTWSRIDKSPLPPRFVTQVAADPSNAAVVYVTFSGFTGFGDNVGHVFRSANGGATWADVSGNLPNIPVNDIVVDSNVPGALYIGTDIGVFASYNTGGLWTPLGDGLPHAIVNALKLHYPSRTLRAATYGRGIWDLSISTTPAASFQVSSTHVGSFLQGQTSAAYTVSVLNAGTGAGSGAVSVTDTLPAGLNASAIAGPGWTCTLQALACNRSDALAPGAAYPPITVTVTVAANAGPLIVNNVSVSGGGSASSTASDPTSILAAFTDVDPADSFLPAIDLLKQHGITSACQAQPPQYCPNDLITEAQMAVFIVRSVVGGDNFTFTPAPYFTDVPATNLYFPWIQKMKDLGIAVSCSATQFCPDSAVTRGIMSVLIVRGRYGIATPASYPATPFFTDVATNHPYFPWIQKMKQFGITSGCSPTTYCPDDPVTRGQMAVFIMRGEFNQLLPASVPIVFWTSPASANRGQGIQVTIVGQNTSFGGATQIDAGAGITVSNIHAVSATMLTAQVSIAPSAPAGPHSITVTTGSEEATLPNGFTVR